MARSPINADDKTVDRLSPHVLGGFSRRATRLPRTLRFPPRLRRDFYWTLRSYGFRPTGDVAQHEAAKSWHVQRVMNARTDAEGEQHGADACLTTEPDADRQHRQLDDRPNRADGTAASDESGHDAVSWARAESGAQIERYAETPEWNRGEQVSPLQDRFSRYWHMRQCDIRRDAEQKDRDDGADADALAKRNPCRERAERDDYCSGADRNVCSLVHAIGQHLPWTQAEIGPDHQHECDTRDRDTRAALDETTKNPISG